MQKVIKHERCIFKVFRCCFVFVCLWRICELKPELSVTNSENLDYKNVDYVGSQTVCLCCMEQLMSGVFTCEVRRGGVWSQGVEGDQSLVRLTAWQAAHWVADDSRATTHLFKSTRKEVTRHTSETGMNGVLSLYGNAACRESRWPPTLCLRGGSGVTGGLLGGLNWCHIQDKMVRQQSEIWSAGSVNKVLLHFYPDNYNTGPSCCL